MATMKLLMILALIFVIDIRSADSAKCAVMTAAVEGKGVIRFFFGHRMVTFGAKKRWQISSKYVSAAYGLPRARVHVSAAYHPKGDPKTTIIISGSKYYRHRLGSKATGPHRLSIIFKKDKYFSSGVDAATSYRGRDYFFKGCKIMIRYKNGAVSYYDLRRMDIPCKVRSAWTRSGYMVVSKGGMSWRIKALKAKPKSVCFANYFHTSINMCKCKAG